MFSSQTARKQTGQMADPKHSHNKPIPGTATSHSTKPPAFGAVGIFDVELSKTEYWTDEERCYFRSLEFDVETSAATFEEALQGYLSQLIAYARHLSELGEAIYSREEDMLAQLSPRLVQIAQKAIFDMDKGIRISECGWWIEQEPDGAWPHGRFLYGRPHLRLV